MYVHMFGFAEATSRRKVRREEGRDFDLDRVAGVDVAHLPLSGPPSTAGLALAQLS